MMSRDNHRAICFARAMLICMAVSISGIAGGAIPAFGQQEARHFEQVVEHELSLDYLIALPEGYSATGEAVPLLLFLHGAGERGSDLEWVKVHGPPKLIERGDRLPAIVVSP